MYCDYWNLQKAPFDNVPDPSMYADCHATMENVIAETIFAIKEADESFAVIIGEPGSGKTLSLKIIRDTLESQRYKSIVINTPGMSFTDLLKEIIGQINGAPCEENSKGALLDTFRQLLIQSMQQEQKIVIFIDEADTLSPANLENLRQLANIQDTHNNFFTIVLAGPIELARRLEHPKRANLFQRIGIYSRIDKLPSPDVAKNYIETRLKLAGTSIKIFSDDAIPVIWEYSEQGVPRLINKICKLCLKAGETNFFDYVSADTAWQIAQRFQRFENTAIQQRKPRSRQQDMNVCELIVAKPEDPEKFSNELSPVHQKEGTAMAIDNKTETQSPIDDAASIADETSSEADAAANEELSTEQIASSNPQLPDAAEMKSEHNQSENETFPLPEENNAATTSLNDSSQVESEPENISDKTSGLPANDRYDEIRIGEHVVKLDIPKDILKQVKSFNRESANKSAGFWAAQIIKKNPQLTSSALADPVQIWHEIKDSILKKIAL